MLSLFLILTAAAPQEIDLPLTQATLLRDTGCWLRWEGEVPAAQGPATFRLANDVELSTLSVEQFDKGEWRVTDFAIQDRSAAPAADSKTTTHEHGVLLRVS